MIPKYSNLVQGMTSGYPISNMIFRLNGQRSRSYCHRVQNHTTEGDQMAGVSIHKSAEFGWFYSINDKIINNLPRWGRRRLQPNFRWPLAAKLLTGPKMFREWNDGTDHLYHRAKCGGNRTTHLGVRGRSVMFFTFFVNNARPHNGRQWRMQLLYLRGDK